MFALVATLRATASSVAGVDWASKNHHVYLIDGNGKRLGEREFRHVAPAWPKWPMADRYQSSRGHHRRVDARPLRGAGDARQGARVRESTVKKILKDHRIRRIDAAQVLAICIIDEPCR